jgi:hypothetical protein
VDYQIYGVYQALDVEALGTNNSLVSDAFRRFETARSSGNRTAAGELPPRGHLFARHLKRVRRVQFFEKTQLARKMKEFAGRIGMGKDRGKTQGRDQRLEFER